MTTAPRNAVPCRDRSNVRRFPAIRVPPNRSATRFVACCMATDTSWWASTVVSLVSVVAN